MSPQEESTTEPCDYTLDPLCTEGPDALAPDHTAGIIKVSLCQLEIQWENAAFDTTIQKGANLLDSEAAENPIPAHIPSNAVLACATFDFQLHDFDRPHKVSIRPPENLSFEFPADASRLIPWLDKHGFRLIRRLAQALALPMLALVCALSAVSDLDDQDDDDIDSDRYVLPA